MLRNFMLTRNYYTSKIIETIFLYLVINLYWISLSLRRQASFCTLPRLTASFLFTPNSPTVLGIQQVPKNSGVFIEVSNTLYSRFLNQLFKSFLRNNKNSKTETNAWNFFRVEIGPCCLRRVKEYFSAQNLRIFHGTRFEKHCSASCTVLQVHGFSPKLNQCYQSTRPISLHIAANVADRLALHTPLTLAKLNQSPSIVGEPNIYIVEIHLKTASVPFYRLLSDRLNRSNTVSKFPETWAKVCLRFPLREFFRGKYLLLFPSRALFSLLFRSPYFACAPRERRWFI